MKWSTWMQHYGGSCPVLSHLKVRCICRGDVDNEYFAEGFYATALEWDWSWHGVAGDILLYQYEMDE